MEKVNVCCFCETWESGGIESFLYNVLMRMDLQHVQVDLVASRLGRSIFTQPLERHGVCFFELSGNPRRVGANHRAFRRLLKERSYDVVHLNLFQGLSLAYGRLAKQAGVPVRIAHSHNTALRKSGTRPVKLLLHHAAKLAYTGSATDLWACSQQAGQFLFSKGQLKMREVRFIPNGIAVERFRFDGTVREAVRGELGLGDKFVIGNVGRLCGQKNQAFLLDVFAEVASSRPESRLLLVGEGPDEAVLRSKAQQMGIADKVIFYGVSEHIEQLLWAMDVFVLPSHFEGLPVTSIEAQAAGLPCIFSDVITRECCLGGMVWFLSLNDTPQRWAELAIQASSQVHRNEGASAVQRTGFDIDTVSNQIEYFYLASCGLYEPEHRLKL